MPTLEERVTRLEVDMAEQKRLRAGQDSDLSDISQKVRAQDQLLKAIATTQSEHTATLAGHTATLADHTATLADHTAILTDLTATLADHTAILADHTATLADHTAILTDHTATLADHTRRFERLEGNVDSLKDGMGKIIGMLDILIERDGRR